MLRHKRSFPRADVLFNFGNYFLSKLGHLLRRYWNRVPSEFGVPLLDEERRKYFRNCVKEQTLTMFFMSQKRERKENPFTMFSSTTDNVGRSIRDELIMMDVYLRCLTGGVTKMRSESYNVDGRTFLMHLIQKQQSFTKKIRSLSAILEKKGVKELLRTTRNHVLLSHQKVLHARVRPQPKKKRKRSPRSAVHMKLEEILRRAGQDLANLQQILRGKKSWVTGIALELRLLRSLDGLMSRLGKIFLMKRGKTERGTPKALREILAKENVNEDFGGFEYFGTLLQNLDNAERLPLQYGYYSPGSNMSCDVMSIISSPADSDMMSVTPQSVDPSPVDSLRSAEMSLSPFSVELSPVDSISGLDISLRSMSLGSPLALVDDDEALRENDLDFLDDFM